MEQIWERMDSFPDGVAALVMGAWIDRHLEEAIKITFSGTMDKSEANSLFVNQGMLESVGAKVKIAYAMGIIGAVTKEAITSVAAIRNAFAHASEIITFDTKEIVEKCKTLTFAKTLNSLNLHWFPKPLKEGSSPRDSYIQTCLNITILLMIYQGEFQSKKEIRTTLLTALEDNDQNVLRRYIHKATDLPVLP